jgi:hypothetical protein
MDVIEQNSTRQIYRIAGVGVGIHNDYRLIETLSLMAEDLPITINN